MTFPKIWSAAKISFQLPTNYNITTYTIRLSKHDFVDGEIKSNDTVSITNVTAIDVSNRYRYVEIHFDSVYCPPATGFVNTRMLT